MNTIVNIILFQLGWFACVLSASYQLEWLAVSSLAIIIAFHVYLANNRQGEILIILSAACVGIIVDSTMITFNVFSANHAITISGMAPLWLIGLWMLFGITLNHSLRWFHQHLQFAALAGLVFAPLAYWSGHRLGALQFNNDYAHYWALLIIGVCWFFVTPFLLWVSQRLERKVRTLQAS